MTEPWFDEQDYYPDEAADYAEAAQQEPRPTPGCECDWKNCGHKGRTVPSADHGDIRTSPGLCTACLFACEAEREDEHDSLYRSTLDRR